MSTCPTCQGASRARLREGEACASCRATQAWAALGASGLVIDRAAIAAAELRRRGEAAREPWWKRRLVWLWLAAMVALAGGAAWSIVPLFAARPVGPLAALLDALLRASQRATVIGGVTALVTIVAWRRLRRTRHARSVPAVAAHACALATGLAALVIGAVHWLSFATAAGPQYTTMPARAALDVSVQLERVVNATVVVLAPDADGDARRGAMGTGAIVAADARRAWILTCSHVAMPYADVGAFRRVAGAPPVWVQLADGRAGRAAVRWAAPPPLDLVLLELPIELAPEPAPISLEGSELPVGSTVIFVPNPYRAGWLVKQGQLLRREPHRTPAGDFDLLYTDLPVTHGDSGSGLFDAQGRLIGLNTWTRVGHDGRSHGISLPSSAMRELVDAIERGQFDQPARE